MTITTQYPPPSQQLQQLQGRKEVQQLQSESLDATRHPLIDNLNYVNNNSSSQQQQGPSQQLLLPVLESKPATSQLPAATNITANITHQESIS
jgi:hypothetical protein